uniref:Uncharacterized protein n=1 Tax=Mus musculus TaxID=10090 RepID=Q8BRT7_MOUSE|nr:unnamed protein product [Mus musculus]
MPTGTPLATGGEVLPSATMTEGTLAADEVRVPLGASPSAPAAPVRASPASPGVPGREEQRGSGSSVLAPESPGTEVWCGPGRRRGTARPIPRSGCHSLLLPRANHAAPQLVPPTGL